MEHYYKNIEGWFTYPNLYSFFINNTPNGGKIAEIGVWKGSSVAYAGVEIINLNKNIELYAIDSFEGCNSIKEQMNDAGIINKNLYEIFCENISLVSHVVKPIKSVSWEAADKFEDNYFDVVFIDASHEYVNVKKDIEAWYPKVKNGGFFAGHDYPSFSGVVQAVNEFFPAGNFNCTNELCWIHKK